MISRTKLTQQICWFGCFTLGKRIPALGQLRENHVVGLFQWRLFLSLLLPFPPGFRGREGWKANSESCEAVWKGHKMCNILQQAIILFFSKHYLHSRLFYGFLCASYKESWALGPAKSGPVKRHCGTLPTSFKANESPGWWHSQFSFRK